MATDETISIPVPEGSVAYFIVGGHREVERALRDCTRQNGRLVGKPTVPQALIGRIEDRGRTGSLILVEPEDDPDDWWPAYADVHGL